jgi:hypothetical protein
MAEQLEEFIDKEGMRNLPNNIIKDFRNLMRSSPQNRRRFDDFAAELKPVIDQLSRELKIFLYGKA